jgi:hypothetical protein
VSVPYRAVRLAAGAVAVLVSLFVLVSRGAAVATALGLVAFAIGWYLARRFGKPGDAAAMPWLDTMLPFGIALLAILPAVLSPFLGDIGLDVGIAIVLPLIAGMALALAFGPYADQKVALAR